METQVMKILPVLIISAFFAISVTSFFGCIKQTVSQKDPWRNVVNIAEKSVVKINIYGVDPKTGVNQKRGSGSGTVISDNGLIVTAAHVLNIQDSLYKPSFTVEFLNGKVYPVYYTRSHPVYDIGIMRIKMDSSKIHANFCSSKPLPATPILVYGNAAPFPFWFSSGIISKHQVIPEIDSNVEWMLFDADVNPGVSGGPIFTMEGCIVGAVSAFSTVHNGVSIAVPGVWVEKSVLQLVARSFFVIK